MLQCAKQLIAETDNYVDVPNQLEVADTTYPILTQEPNKSMDQPSKWTIGPVIVL